MPRKRPKKSRQRVIILPAAQRQEKFGGEKNQGSLYLYFWPRSGEKNFGGEKTKQFMFFAALVAKKNLEADIRNFRHLGRLGQIS